MRLTRDNVFCDLAFVNREVLWKVDSSNVLRVKN